MNEINKDREKESSRFLKASESGVRCEPVRVDFGENHFGVAVPKRRIRVSEYRAQP